MYNASVLVIRRVLYTHGMDIIGISLVTIETFGAWSYVIVFLICFVETLAFVGTFFPGGFAIIAIGFLSAYTTLSIWILVLVAAFGAIAGDCFSYYLGTKGTRWFKHENKLLKLVYLEKAQSFFKKHGDKSVFLGRFVGVVKPIMPFVAGLSKMDIKKFLFWDTLSGTLWAMLHLGLGYFLGSSFEELHISNTIKLLFVVVPLTIGIVWTVSEYRERIIEIVRRLQRG